VFYLTFARERLKDVFSFHMSPRVICCSRATGCAGLFRDEWGSVITKATITRRVAVSQSVNLHLLPGHLGRNHGLTERIKIHNSAPAFLHKLSASAVEVRQINAAAST